MDEYILEACISGVKRKHSQMSAENATPRCWRSLSDKKQILDYIEEGRSYTWITQKTGAPRSTIGNIRKIKDKILTELSEGRNSNKKKLKDAVHPDVDKAMYIWWTQQKIVGENITRESFRDKALMFHERFCENSACSFLATKGWARGFKERYAIGSLGFRDKTALPNAVLMENFCDLLRKTANELGLSAEQIYSAEDIPLQWRKLPSETLAAVDEKVQKDRISFIACSNATGTSRPPIQIVTRAFKSSAPQTPWSSSDNIYCAHAQHRWGSLDLFKDWFQKIFIPSIEEYSEVQNIDPKAVLLVSSINQIPDNINTDDIKILQVPQNNLPNLLPINQDSILQFIRTTYRKRLIQKIVSDEESWIDILLMLDTPDVYDLIEDSWKCLSNETILETWSNLLLIDAVDNIEHGNLLNDEIDQFVLALEDIGESTTKQKLIDWILTADVQILSDDDIYEVVKSDAKPVLIVDKFNEEQEYILQEYVVEEVDEEEAKERLEQEEVEQEDDEGVIVVEEIKKSPLKKFVKLNQNQVVSIPPDDGSEHKVLESFNVLINYYKTQSDQERCETVKKWRNDFLMKIKTDD